MRFGWMAAAAAMMTAGQASAATITKRFEFTASGFSSFSSGSTSPYSVVRGAFDLTFNNAADLLNRPVDALISLTFSAPGPIVFSYTALTDRLSIGGNGDARTLSGGTDFAVFFNGASSARPSPNEFVYTLAERPDDGYVASNVTFGAVPEPSAWILMVFGFGAVGQVIRQGRLRPRVRLI